MYLSILAIKLVFPFLLCQRANSLGQSFLHNQSVSKNQIDDDLVNKFLVEFIKPYVEKSEFRQITVIARETSDLLKVQPLLEIHPYVICQHKIQWSKSLWLSQRSLVINFLGDSSKEMIERELEEMSMYSRCKFLFISDGTIHFDDVWMTFTLAMKRRLTYVKLAHVVGNAVRLYTNYIAKNCSMGVRVIAVWKPGDSLPSVEVDGWTHQVRDPNGCSVSVIAADSKPDMMIKENEDGLLSIVGGREGLLILTLAEKLNFNISVINPISHSGDLKILSTIRNVIYGNDDIAIGNLPPISGFFSNDYISFSYPYVEECITWSVPRRIIRPKDIVWVEFRWQVWILVGLTFVISCAIGYAYLRMILVKRDKQTREGFVTILLDAVAIHLGMPVVYVSSSASGRFMLLALLYYSIVITTAYKSSLSATLTENKGTSAIVDVEGIFNANITVRASSLNYMVYKLQSDSGRHFLLPRERFVFDEDISDNFHLFLNDDNNAFLASRTWLNYVLHTMIKSGKSINFDILDGCEMKHHFMLYLTKESKLANPIDEIIHHLIEAGFLDHWGIEKLDVSKILMQQMLEEYYQNRATDQFRDIFIFYFGCVAFCLLAFFIELLTL